MHDLPIYFKFLSEASGFKVSRIFVGFVAKKTVCNLQI
jgi:hypothetical protein